MKASDGGFNTTTNQTMQSLRQAPPANNKISTLDKAKPLDASGFPNPPRGRSSQLRPTIANMRHLLAGYGISVRYNEVKKKSTFTIPGHSGSPDNFDRVALTQIMSLADLNELSKGNIADVVEAIGDRNRYNPAADWILSKPWDGVDRLPAFHGTLVQQADFPADLKETLMYRWALSAVAAALKPSGFHSRGVLVLQGRQSMGKTAWAKALVSDEALSQEVIKLGHHLDAGDKDSLLGAMGHWMVEIGELDSTFRKEVARLKATLTDLVDKIRPPYGRTPSEYQRRTVFCATVNDANFLVDTTGNTRWWTIPLDRIDYKHGIDMQQVFAQLALDFYNGEQWWLTSEEEQRLEEQNKRHRRVSALRERLLDAVDLRLIGDGKLKAYKSTEVLKAIGIDHPTDAQYKELKALLEELNVRSTLSHGVTKWRMPFKVEDSLGFARTDWDDSEPDEELF